MRNISLSYHYKLEKRSHELEEDSCTTYNLLVIVYRISNFYKPITETQTAHEKMVKSVLITEDA